MIDRFRDWSGTASREHQPRGGALVEKLDTAIDTADQRGRGGTAGADTATEDDDGIRRLLPRFTRLRMQRRHL